MNPDAGKTWVELGFEVRGQTITVRIGDGHRSTWKVGNYVVREAQDPSTGKRSVEGLPSLSDADRKAVTAFLLSYRGLAVSHG